MSVTTDYYNVLGLVPSAEIAVIRAAYRALVTIYHPDKNASSEAQEKIRTINIAYETLSDPTRRKQYDASREQQAHNASSSEFDCDKPFDADPLEKAWAIAVSFYTSIDSDYNDLAKISWRLAFAFKLQLLEEQEYSNSKDIAYKLKAEYLTRYFGNDKEVRDYAEQLIKARELQAALYLNDIVNVMGKSVGIWSVTKKVSDKFPQLSLKLEKRILYARANCSNGWQDIAAAEQLLKLHGGFVKRSLFSSKMIMTLDGKQLSFESSDEFCRYVLALYEGQYA